MAMSMRISRICIQIFLILVHASFRGIVIIKLMPTVITLLHLDATNNNEPSHHGHDIISIVIVMLKLLYEKETWETVDSL